MDETSPALDGIVSAISTQLEVMSQARDRALAESRQIIRHSANAIRALHRGNFEDADQHLGTGRQMVQAMTRDLTGLPDLYWAGYVQDAQKEYAEASIVAAMIRNVAPPTPTDLGVEKAPYLNGLAEAASEMRRYVLDMIRKGEGADMTEAERILGLMDDVYSCLVTVDFPDSITGGLRRTTDSLRAVLERTRGDLTISLRQAELAKALRLKQANQPAE